MFFKANSSEVPHPHLTFTASALCDPPRRSEEEEELLPLSTVASSSDTTPCSRPHLSPHTTTSCPKGCSLSVCPPHRKDHYVVAHLSSSTGTPYIPTNHYMVQLQSSPPSPSNSSHVPTAQSRTAPGIDIPSGKNAVLNRRRRSSPRPGKSGSSPPSPHRHTPTCRPKTNP